MHLTDPPAVLPAFRSGACRWWQGLLAAGALLGGLAFGADWKEAQELWLSGRYADCATLAGGMVESDDGDEEWHLLRAKACLALGRYEEAYASITNSMRRFPPSIRVRLLAREVFLRNGQVDAAQAMVIETLKLAEERPWRYREPASRVAFGQMALLMGADPRRVLERLFDTARKEEPTLREAYLATGELALGKHDFAVAARAFRDGLERFPDDPDFHCGLARAYASSDRPQAVRSLATALERNPNHVPSLLELADHAIDAEEYAEAEQQSDRALTVNPRHAVAWAYKAILAQLRNEAAAAETARTNALRDWPTNPEVDHLIGRKLSEQYRFAEGAAHQRLALAFDAQHLPALSQLARDLLRLGEEAEGWQLAEQVHERDGYDVAAYNLVTLRETLGRFQTLSNEHFVVRLSAHEAAVYGPRVLAVLEQARQTLGAKYGLEPRPPTVVEIFPDQKDFAVRTFGMPGNPGYLGVCFGRVITANSPAAQARRPVNWEAVLWHEFCHVVTLQMTRNRMPRWLSEGISVYEERLANPAWGQQMNPAFRSMILEGDLKPVSDLSAAFLSPPSDDYLDFAYYQSSLVVEFLVERFGIAALKAILHDLGVGAEINQAIARHTAPLAEVDRAFNAFARDRAQRLGPGLDWQKPDLALLAAPGTDALTAWAAGRSTNYWALTHQARQLVEARQWVEAKAVLDRLLAFCPEVTGSDNPYRLLAEVHAALGEAAAERAVLNRLAELEADAPDVYLRLMELGVAAQDWPAVIRDARRYLAVNPLVGVPYRYLAQAAEASGEARTACEAYETWLRLDPPNPAEVRYRLARLLHQAGEPTARRHLLLALEDAPRFRDALDLLYRMQNAAAP